ncbi:MAG TPA: FG-GAP-like repeat-containing protein, partial [Polyangiaceae bacterium]|nr:FG-GAP-like repeat-containing protein [Polyangiaceae bacterium]
GSAFISRETDRGVPTYDDRSSWHSLQDRFVFKGGQELVPICDVGGDLGCAGALSGEVMPTWSAGWQYHRARVEGAFMRFFWSPDRKTWRVQSKDGTTLELGVPLDGSGYTDALESNPSAPNEVFRWNLVREYDTYTEDGTESGAPLNTVVYRYLKDGNSVYVSDIYDTSPVDQPVLTANEFGRYAHRTHLTWETRTDPTVSYRSGYRMEQNLRLSRVTVSSAPYGNEGRQFLRAYQLTYDDRYHVSLLDSVQIFGRCEQPQSETEAPDPKCSNLPPMRFGYSHVGDPVDEFEPVGGSLQALENAPPVAISDSQTDLFDVNSDGLPDVVVSDLNHHAGKYTWYENGGTGELATFAAPQLMPLIPQSSGDVGHMQLSNAFLRTLDLDGDGRSNLLFLPKRNVYSVWDFKPNGSGYALVEREAKTLDGNSPQIRFDDQGVGTTLMDVNFDGLVDVVVSSGNQLRTYLALGRLPGGIDRFGKITGNPTPTAAPVLSPDPITTCNVTDNGRQIDFTDPEFRTADMNGDGILDVVHVWNSGVKYWPGRGNGFWGTGDRNSCADLGNRHVTMTNAPIVPETNARVEDVNGDGLADLI